MINSRAHIKDLIIGILLTMTVLVSVRDWLLYLENGQLKSKIFSLSGQMLQAKQNLLEMRQNLEFIAVEAEQLNTEALTTLQIAALKYNLPDKTKINSREKLEFKINSLNNFSAFENSRFGNAHGAVGSYEASDVLIHLSQNIRYSSSILLDYFQKLRIEFNQTSYDYRNVPSILPVRGPITGHFGYRSSHPILGIKKLHKGIDIFAEKGSEVLSVARGKVVFVGRSHSYGSLIKIRHSNGVETKYAHNSKVLVRRGQIVQKGEKIAEVGSTGHATGPHCHFEILLGGEPVDPELFIPEKNIMLATHNQLYNVDPEQLVATM